MLTKIIFSDGTVTTIEEAAHLIGRELKSGSDLKGIYNGVETYVFWRTTRMSCYFESASGSTLGSVRIKRINEMQFDLE